MVFNFDFLISRLTDIVQKCFCTPDGATDSAFQSLSHLACLYTANLVMLIKLH